jgi:Flp pilus assembly protein TadG
MSRLLSRPRRRARFLRDQRGVSAIEFAFIAPIMILLYMGLAEITLTMMAERRASHSASAVGDLVAQSPAAMASADIDQVLYIGKAVVMPYSTAGLTMRVSSVKADAAGTPRVVWSKVQGSALTKLAQNSTVSGFPAGLIVSGESVIMSDVVYTYDTPLKKIIPRTLRFSETFYLRPRRAAEITCADCPP